MKTAPIFILIALSISISSCSEFYFSKPQPVDVENIYQVPSKYTGVWLKSDEKDKIDSIFITEDYYKRVTRSIVKELKSKMESDTNVYFIDNKVYSKENGDLEGGYKFTIVGDSVFIDVVLTDYIEFGPRAFFRKINYGYILNQKHEKMNDWWSIKFIDIRNSEKLLIKSLSSKEPILFTDFTVLHEDFDNYLIAKWNSAKIEEFIDLGAFSNSVLELKYAERIKTK